YPGLPGPRISAHLSREESRPHYDSGTEFHIARIEMVANTGTYLDTPFHRFADGYDLVGLPLDRVAEVEGVVVRVLEREAPAIGPEVFESLDVAGKAVLVPHRLGPPLGDRQLLRGPPPFDRIRRRVPGRKPGPPGRDRLLEHRRHRRRGPTRPHGPAGRRHPHRRAPVRPQRASRDRFSV